MYTYCMKRYDILVDANLFHNLLHREKMSCKSQCISFPRLYTHIAVPLDFIFGLQICIARQYDKNDATNSLSFTTHNIMEFVRSNTPW